jgi:N-carbamoyl-L-amino-acid hydrolase
VSVTAGDLEARLDGLAAVGVSERGVDRLAWTPEDAACRAWFEAQARAGGLTPVRDPAGNLWACPAGEPPWWGVGSHLDSVRGGGRFDGPLGVACGFAIAAVSARPLAVVSFADEEGARFNTPTFGSKALTGRLEIPAVLGRRDAHGTALADAMAAAGVDPEGLGRAPEWVQRLRGFVEIHIDQSMGVQAAEVPLSVVSSLAARMRLEVEVRGRADHAGTTPRSERRDALGAAARLIVAADELGAELTVTTARLEVEPNAATTIASRVRMWIDGRGSDPEALGLWEDELRAAAAGLARASRTEIELRVASRSDGARFDPGLRAALRRAAARTVGSEVPEHVCYAGHDAGVLSERIPAAMVLVRNPTGVSHAPAEAVSLADAAVAANVVAAALEAGA